MIAADEEEGMVLSIICNPQNQPPPQITMHHLMIIKVYLIFTLFMPHQPRPATNPPIPVQLRFHCFQLLTNCDPNFCTDHMVCALLRLC